MWPGTRYYLVSYMDETPEIRERRIRFGGEAGVEKPISASGIASVTARRVGIAGLTFSACHLVFEILYQTARQPQVTHLRGFFLANSIVGILSGLLLY